MRSSFTRLYVGLGFAFALVYFLLVVNFQLKQAFTYHHRAPWRIGRGSVGFSFSPILTSVSALGSHYEHRRDDREQFFCNHLRQ
jgi:hypothetical protein